MTPTATPTTISDVIRRTVASRGLTAYRVAEMADMAYDPVARFLKGERDIRLATAEKLAAALGLVLVEVLPD